MLPFDNSYPYFLTNFCLTHKIFLHLGCVHQARCSVSTICGLHSDHGTIIPHISNDSSEPIVRPYVGRGPLHGKLQEAGFRILIFSILLRPHSHLYFIPNFHDILCLAHKGIRHLAFVQQARFSLFNAWTPHGDIGAPGLHIVHDPFEPCYGVLHGKVQSAVFRKYDPHLYFLPNFHDIFCRGRKVILHLA